MQKTSRGMRKWLSVRMARVFARVVMGMGARATLRRVDLGCQPVSFSSQVSKAELGTARFSGKAGCYRTLDTKDSARDGVFWDERKGYCKFAASHTPYDRPSSGSAAVEAVRRLTTGTPALVRTALMAATSASL